MRNNNDFGSCLIWIIIGVVFFLFAIIRNNPHLLLYIIPSVTLIVLLIIGYIKFSNLIKLKNSLYELKKNNNSNISSLNNELKELKTLMQNEKELRSIEIASNIKLRENIKKLEDKVVLTESLIKSKDKSIIDFIQKNWDDDFFLKISIIKEDFILSEFETTQKYFETKKHPAFVKAREVRDLKIKTKEIVKKHNHLLYNYELLFATFPELEDYLDNVKDLVNLNKFTIDEIKEDYDYSRNYLSKEEYKELSVTDRNQLALDRYIKGDKNNWQIGRDFELYCGQQYEKDGWKVEYFGIEKKLNDLGRDLMAYKDNIVHVVQCKHWRKDWQIREKHIMQLYGTSKMYELQNNSGNLFDKDVIPVFISNSKLSETAQEFADVLGIKVIYNSIDVFPRIKCNISNSGDKIYHLPFDQQYDRTKINKNGEFYAYSIKEAEKEGFNRAKKFFNK